MRSAYWEMSKPAVRSRKPKPEAMFARCRLSMVLWTIHQNSASSATTSMTWIEEPAHLGSIEEIRRLVAGCAGDHWSLPDDSHLELPGVALTLNAQERRRLSAGARLACR